MFINSETKEGHLVIKLVIIFCYYGALRMSECCAILRSDVKLTPKGLMVKIIRKKTDKAALGQTFVVPSVTTAPNNPLSLFKEYMSLTENTTHPRLFLTYSTKTKRFINSPIGKNMMATYPKLVAEFLMLDKPESYTGHSLRATSATVLADGGSSMENIKRHGQWRSATVVEGYIRESKKHKVDIAESLTSTTTTTASSSSSSSCNSTTNVQGSVFINCVFEGNPPNL
jgi:integrase